VPILTGATERSRTPPGVPRGSLCCGSGGRYAILVKLALPGLRSGIRALTLISEGDHYVLWRVYQAHTITPTAKAFSDPASLIRTSGLQLELSALRAFVEPKD
jgi:hypothetical protein